MYGIADYEFVRSLGAGNHGQFFLARRPLRLPIDVEFVAVKVLCGESTADTFRRATGAMKALAAVRSPHLVNLYDAGQHDGIFYYSMEFLPGGTLAHPAYPLDRVAAVRGVADAARALTALHGAGITHREVKPSNLLLSASGTKLSDLGLAAVFTPGVMLTGLGEFGSIEYADPDLLRGAVPGPHHDVWSLGVMLHRIASGTGVYGELSTMDGLTAVRRVLSTRPEVSPALPAPLADVVRGCLAPVGERLPAAAVADRLSTVAV